MKTCTLPDCNRTVVAKGLCASHYQAQRLAAIRAGARAVSRPCARCGNDLAGKRPNAIYCSVECKEAAIAARFHAEAKERHAGRICIQCGSSIESDSGKAKTCSRVCGIAWQNDKRRTEQLAAWNAKKQPCPQCGNEVPESRWGAIYCSPACRKRTLDASWRAKSPGYMRQYLYGITPEQFAERLAAQDNRCAICRTDVPGGKGSWHVDHDHATKAVRGLLCHNCNVALGNFRDDPTRLLAAARYLGQLME